MRSKCPPTEAPLGRPTHLQHLTWCEQSRTKTPACNYPVKIILHCQGLINQLHYWFLSCHCNISAHRKMAFCPAKVKTGAAPGPNITRSWLYAGRGCGGCCHLWSEYCMMRYGVLPSSWLVSSPDQHLRWYALGIHYHYLVKIGLNGASECKLLQQVLCLYNPVTLHLHCFVM